MFKIKMILHLLVFFSMIYCQASERREQLIFSNIILDPVFVAAQKNGVGSHRINDILSGKVSTGYQTKINFSNYNENTDWVLNQEKFKISIEQVQKSFIISASNMTITELTELDNNKSQVFYRKNEQSTSWQGNDVHLSFSQRVLTHAFQKVDLFPELVAQGLKTVNITVLSVRKEENSTIAFFKLHDDNQIMLLSYTNEIVTGNNCFQLNGNDNFELWGIHTKRYQQSFFLSDLFVMNQQGDGFDCEFFPSGLVKNYVASSARIWGKQKTWNEKGEIEAEYVYPPGKILKQPIVNEFFPDWCTYIDGAKNIRYTKREYWDFDTKSPCYSISLSTFENGNYEITSLFAKDNVLLNRKFDDILKEKENRCVSQSNIVFVENDKSFQGFKVFSTVNKNGNYLEVIFKEGNMIIILDTRNNTIENIIKVVTNIIHAYELSCGKK